VSDYSPPSPSAPLTAALVAVLAAVFAYSVLIVHQLLLGLVPALLAAVAYYAWRVLAALEAIADGV